MNPGRRRFVRVAATATVGGALAACGGGSTPSAPISPATPTPGALPAEARVPLMSVGETVAAAITLVSGLSTPIAVTRLADAAVVAVSRICTHMGCTVGLPAARGATLDCPCHGSRYTTGGAVVNGPAERALTQFPAVIQGNEVVVSASL